MKKIVLLLIAFLAFGVFYSCLNKTEIEELSTADKIQMYLPDGFENNISLATQSIIVGLEQGGTNKELLENSK